MRTRLGLLLTLAGLAGLTACAPTEEWSVGLDPEDIAEVELKFYDYGDPDAPAEYESITNPGLIAELVHAFTDMPSTPTEVDSQQSGRATDLRFISDDGEITPLTQIFIEPHNVIIVWSTGEATRTKWGVPLEDYYDDLGDVGTSEG